MFLETPHGEANDSGEAVDALATVDGSRGGVGADVDGEAQHERAPRRMARRAATSSGTIGTEGALAFTDTEERDSLARILCSIVVDNTASAIYTFPPTGIAQLFGGIVPPYHALYVAQNCSTTTTAGIASSGSAIYYTPAYWQYT
jgi:hypothetical protein